jgi:cobalt-zinc-cadmium resistance protein CzcA
LWAFALVAFFGVRALLTVPVDAFPDVTPNQVNVYTESPGLAAEDVEKLLTTPIETAMAGLPGRRANPLGVAVRPVLRRRLFQG